MEVLISNEEKSALGCKVSKESLTFLLGGNAASNYKLKPLFVYSSENPRALRGITSHPLPVTWKLNKIAWMTTEVLEDG